MRQIPPVEAAFPHHHQLRVSIVSAVGRESYARPRPVSQAHNQTGAQLDVTAGDR
jgi:hypothetical protein